MEKPVLILKAIESSDSDTDRIFNLTKEAVDRLNIFVNDFFNTQSILKENLLKAQNNNDSNTLKETKESLSQIQLRFSEIKEDMNKIAADLPQLIEIDHQ
jgi:hypothetical protein